MGDPLNYLLELGFTLDEVETLKSRNDFTCQEMADAAKAIVDRGGNPLEAFGPRAIPPQLRPLVSERAP